MSQFRIDLTPSSAGAPAPSVARNRVVAREVDCMRSLRTIERGRRSATPSPKAATDFLAEVTVCSFTMEGLAVENDVDRPAPLLPKRRPLRSRTRARMRNHLAILMLICRCSGRGIPVRQGDVLRWYTSISSGLCTSVLSVSTMSRIGQVVERINSPQLRLQPAITEIATLHANLLAEPIFPSFNGILARLLLTAHLTRCDLPPVKFDPNRDIAATDAAALFPRLCQLLGDRFTAEQSESKSV